MKAAFASRPCSAATAKVAACHCSPVAGRVAVRGRLGEGPQEAALLGAQLLGLDREGVAPDLEHGALRGIRLEPAAHGGQAGLEVGCLGVGQRRALLGLDPRRHVHAGTCSSSARWAKAGRNAPPRPATSASASRSE